MVFSTFDMDQLGEIRRHHWKERLNISKIAKFESDSFEANEYIFPQSCENLQTLGCTNLSLTIPPYKRR